MLIVSTSITLIEHNKFTRDEPTARAQVYYIFCALDCVAVHFSFLFNLFYFVRLFSCQPYFPDSRMYVYIWLELNCTFFAATFYYSLRAMSSPSRRWISYTYILYTMCSVLCCAILFAWKLNVMIFRLSTTAVCNRLLF